MSSATARINALVFACVTSASALFALDVPADKSTVFISAPTLDASKIATYKITSPWQKGEVLLRILAPKKLPDDSARRFLYVLPVEAREESRFGNGLLEIQKLNLHEKFGLIVVAPSFSALPWYADHPSDLQHADETHLLKAVLPEVEKMYPSKSNARMLLGFSKSGWGAFSLILRNPAVFSVAAAWDAPLMKEKPDQFGMNTNFGTQENFEKYQISKLLVANLTGFAGKKRLALTGYGNFKEHMEKAHALLETLKIPHEFSDTPPRAHTWSSGWVESSVEALVKMSDAANK